MSGDFYCVTIKGDAIIPKCAYHQNKSTLIRGSLLGDPKNSRLWNTFPIAGTVALLDPPQTIVEECHAVVLADIVRRPEAERCCPACYKTKRAQAVCILQSYDDTLCAFILHSCGKQGAILGSYSLLVNALFKANGRNRGGIFYHDWRKQRAYNPGNRVASQVHVLNRVLGGGSEIGMWALLRKLHSTGCALCTAAPPVGTESKCTQAASYMNALKWIDPSQPLVMSIEYYKEMLKGFGYWLEAWKWLKEVHCPCYPCLYPEENPSGCAYMRRLNPLQSICSSNVLLEPMHVKNIIQADPRFREVLLEQHAILCKACHVDSKYLAEKDSFCWYSLASLDVNSPRCARS
jgi:hypothetical protein